MSTVPKTKKKRDRKAYSKAWRKANLAQARASHKKWREANLEKARSYGREWRKNNRKKKRAYRLSKEYGMSLDQYDKLFLEQGGRCKICGCFDANLVIDHCHDLHIVRGLLCSDCNKGLGFFKDHVLRLERAIDYLLGKL